MSKNIIEIKVIDSETVEVVSTDKDGIKTVETIGRSSDLSEFDESTKIICRNLWENV
jgi:hypothetical protein